MKLCYALLATALLATPIIAADAPPAPTIPVPMTMSNLQVIATALNIASDSCSRSPDGCVVGLNKAEILAKLEPAAKALQAKAAKPK